MTGSEQQFEFDVRGSVGTLGFGTCVAGLGLWLALFPPVLLVPPFRSAALNRVLGVLSLAVGIYLAVLGVRALVLVARGVPALELDSDGLTTRATVPARRIPWDDVVSVSAVEGKGGKVIVRTSKRTWQFAPHSYQGDVGVQELADLMQVYLGK